MAEASMLQGDSSCPHQLSVAIVGAGFSGLCMGAQLKQAGEASFAIFDASDDIGGTWRDNTYPGCACDVESSVYSFSFAQYPHWSEKFGSQADIWGYQKWVVGKFDLAHHLQLNTRITAATFDEATGVWHLTSAAGEVWTAHVLVLAVGSQSVPATPEIPGLSAFKGNTFHSATWDHTCDLANKRVAVIGTGASAIQIIPAIQPAVKRLFVFQRTPAWVVPRNNAKLGWFSRLPLMKKLRRLKTFLFLELCVGLPMVSNNKLVLRMVEKWALRHMRRQVSDRELQQKLTPRYSIGCKRLLTSDDYYPALAQPNVEVIASGLAQVSGGDTLVAQDGTVVEGVDHIIFTTGFDVGSATCAIDIRGLGGAGLADTWAQQGGPSAYYGMAAAGFPNMFQLLGPNSFLGHNSLVFMAECQAGYVMGLLSWMRAARLKWVEVKAAAQQRFAQRLRQQLQGTVWLSGNCQSWYLNSQGGSSVLWSGLCLQYWWQTLRVLKRDWNAVERAAQLDEGPGQKEDA